MKQQSHVGVVREWCQSLGVLTAVSISRQEAEMKLAAYIPMLLSEFPDGAFTVDSLSYVAKACIKGFPTYPELYNHLRLWWRDHNPLPPLLPPPEPVKPREPPTDEEVAYVRNCVQTIIANMRCPFGETAEPRSPRAAFLTDAQLDRINPLPNGRKRDGAAA